MSEIANGDVKDVKPQSVENYRNIKPEKELSVKELNEAVNEEFKKAAESYESQDTGGQKEYFDDHGIKYREGEHLLPDTEFEVKGYKYKTDDQGRVISAEGKLQVRDHEGKKDITESKSVVGNGEMRETDDRGHLIADRFNSSGGIENLVPMDRHLNRSDYKKMENTLDAAVQDGANVYLKVEPVYENNSARPTEFRATYSIDGEKEMVVFKNESEAKT